MENQSGANLIHRRDGGIVRVRKQLSITNKLLGEIDPVLIPYRKGDKWGFCTPDKKIVIDCVWDYAHIFRDGRALVWKNDKRGFINKSGKIVVPLIYDDVDPFINGMARVAIRKDGRKISGCIDVNGEVIVPLEYETIEPSWRKNYFLVRKNKKLYFLDFQNELSDFFPQKYFEGRAAIKIDDKYGFEDEFGKMIVSNQYDYVSIFVGSKCQVRIGSKHGFINLTGDIVVPIVFEETLHFSEGLAGVMRNKLWGYVNNMGDLGTVDI